MTIANKHLNDHDDVIKDVDGVSTGPGQEEASPLWSATTWSMATSLERKFTSWDPSVLIVERNTFVEMIKPFVKSKSYIIIITIYLSYA